MESVSVGNKAEDAQTLIDDWKEVQRKKFQAEEAEKRLIEKLESLVLSGIFAHFFTIRYT